MPRAKQRAGRVDRGDHRLVGVARLAVGPDRPRARRRAARSAGRRRPARPCRAPGCRARGPARSRPRRGRARCGRSRCRASSVTKSPAAAARRNRSPGRASGWRATVPASALPGNRVATVCRAISALSAKSSISGIATRSLSPSSPTCARGCSSATASTWITRVFELGAVGDRAVARQRPGRRRPDHDRRRRRSAGRARRAPPGTAPRPWSRCGRGIRPRPRRARSARPPTTSPAWRPVEPAIHQELADLADDLRLGVEAHRRVGIVPVADARRGA